MTTILARLSDLAADAFEAEGFARDWGVVRPSDRPDLGEFQVSGALGAAKKAGENPKALAERVADRLRATGRFETVSLAGPGFINLTPTAGTIIADLAALQANPRAALAPAGTPAKVVIDFGGPNVAKAMHVGHLRSSIIGDCLQRLFRFCGANVVSDIHMGDWGLQMGLLIEEIAREQPGLPYFQPGATGPFPAQSPVTMDDLERLYPRAAAAAKDDPERAEAARRATAALQAGEPGYRALWRHFVTTTETGLTREFASLGVKFDEWKGESDADPLIPGMIADLRSRGLAVESEGALVLPITEEGDKKELPPLLLLKSDGAALYGTTDLATILDRVRRHDPDLILYVVDQRQHDHFTQVFRAARKSGIAGHAALEHIGFGTVNGPDGKPFKTRAGGVMKLADLIEMAREEARTRLREQGLAVDLDPTEQEGIAGAVGIAAIKFADLMNHRLTNYVFDLARFVRFEGKTGPYLQYAAVRVKSLLRKAEEEGAKPGALAIAAPAERALALALLLTPTAIETARDKRAPNALADQAFAIAQAFSRFYGEHHILSEADEAVRGARLALSALTLRVLETLLDLLGIPVPERM
ncbi:MAG: arginine--tRNA ligase [Alphaproteobacteria bacterium]|nr:arginine--tRNA ligase [Alphaproteobacteria bacterium]